MARRSRRHHVIVPVVGIRSRIDHDSDRLGTMEDPRPIGAKNDDVTPANSITYIFRPLDRCPMCQSESLRVLGKRLNGPQGKTPWRRIGITTTILRCNRCQLIFPNPLPVPADLRDHYAIDPDHYWGDVAHEESPHYFERQISVLRSLVPDQDTIVALDVGAGMGKCMRALERAGIEAHGIEPSRTFHDACIQQTGIPADRLRCVSVEEAEFAPQRFDVVIFGAVLEHLPDPSAALKKALDWVRPGGFIHFEVPSASWLVGRMINGYYRLTGSGFVSNLSPMHVPYHLYEFTPRTFAVHGAEHGYEVVHMDHFVCETFLPGPLDPLAKAIMARTGTGMQFSFWIKKR